VSKDDCTSCWNHVYDPWLHGPAYSDVSSRPRSLCCVRLLLQTQGFGQNAGTCMRCRSGLVTAHTVRDVLPSGETICALRWGPTQGCIARLLPDVQRPEHGQPRHRAARKPRWHRLPRAVVPRQLLQRRRVAHPVLHQLARQLADVHRAARACTAAEDVSMLVRPWH